MGELDQVDITCQEPFQYGVNRQTRHIARSDVEQHAQGQGAGGGFRVILGGKGVRAKLGGELDL